MCDGFRAMKRIPSTLVTTSRRTPSASSSTELGVLFGFGNKERGQDFSTEYLPIDYSSFQNNDDEYTVNCDADFPCHDDEETSQYDLQDFVTVIGIPILSPFAAFFTFEIVSHGYQSLVEFMSTNMWVAVDGGGTKQLFVLCVNNLG